MHGEVRVTVIATGFDRALPVEHPVPSGRPSGAAGVLSFPTTRGRPSSPSIQAPVPQPPPPRPQPRAPQAPAAGSPDTPEMEIPTFIRRQMD
jgi:hypothetical protein